jgi:hypothetical protein
MEKGEMKAVFYTGKLPIGLTLEKSVVLLPAELQALPIPAGTAFVVINSIDDFFSMTITNWIAKPGRGRIVLFIPGMPYEICTYTSTKMLNAEFYSGDDPAIAKLESVFGCSVNIPLGDNDTGYVHGGLYYTRQCMGSYTTVKTCIDGDPNIQSLLKDGFLTFEDYPCVVRV